MKTAAFQKLVWQKGRELYRDMPWRNNTDPYYVVVSEIMLQQTQVERVISKFIVFIERFPSLQSLADASLADVLAVWSGVGYNRRAKFLHDAAKKIMTDFEGAIPNTLAKLISLPGIGKNTAGAILAYSFNQPVVFVETNIRTVYFQHFFKDDMTVSDKELLQKVIETLPKINKQMTATLSYKQWYQALMDYGTYLKKQNAGQISKSLHYKKQSMLKGSLREVRGQIIRVLTTADMNKTALKSMVNSDERFEPALDGLITDGLVVRTNTILHLTK
jgi:A/G-specific adenine glycosylase